MEFAPALVGVVVLLALGVFFWRRNGPGSGRSFGNRIAAHLGVKRSVFHALLDVGLRESSRETLSRLEKSGVGLQQAAVELARALSSGIERMEARFGRQEMVDAVKPIVASLRPQPETDAHRAIGIPGAHDG
ncbi:MAG: hypothetical protein ABI696_10445 [Rubrivivax sp.]